MYVMKIEFFFSNSVYIKINSYTVFRYIKIFFQFLDALSNFNLMRILQNFQIKNKFLILF